MFIGFGFTNKVNRSSSARVLPQNCFFISILSSVSIVDRARSGRRKEGIKQPLRWRLLPLCLPGRRKKNLQGLWGKMWEKVGLAVHSHVKKSPQGPRCRQQQHRGNEHGEEEFLGKRNSNTKARAGEKRKQQTKRAKEGHGQRYSANHSTSLSFDRIRNPFSEPKITPCLPYPARSFVLSR